MEKGTIQPIVLFTDSHNLVSINSYRNAGDDAMFAIRLWYAKELEKPFKLILPTVNLKANDSQLYYSNPLECLARTCEAHGWPNQGAGFMPYVYLGFAPGLGGYAGAVHWDGQVGLAVLGDACLQAISGYSEPCLFLIGGDPIRCSVDGQRGAIAHELMHTLGWGEHTDTPGLDLSSAEYQEFPRCHLPAQIKAHLLAPPWDVFLQQTPPGSANTLAALRSIRQSLDEVISWLEAND